MRCINSMIRLIRMHLKHAQQRAQCELAEVIMGLHIYTSWENNLSNLDNFLNVSICTLTL